MSLPVLVALIAGAPRLPRVDSPDPFAPLLDVVGLLAWSGSLWLAVVTALAQAAGHGSHAASALLHRLAPSSVRTLVSVAVGASLATGAIAGPALAHPAPGVPRPVSTAAPALDSLDWVTHPEPTADARPDVTPTAVPTPRRSPLPARTTIARRPAVPSQAVVGTAGQDDHASPRAVQVRPGDSLWLIAARALGPVATQQQIATTWPRWWRANRAVIGADPDLIHPGAVLHSPHDQGEA
jgi:nucleoid-associated protein YgaU